MNSIEQPLKDLTEAHGVPGYETPIRATVRKFLKLVGELSKTLVELISRLNPKQVVE